MNVTLLRRGRTYVISLYPSAQRTDAMTGRPTPHACRYTVTLNDVPRWCGEARTPGEAIDYATHVIDSGELDENPTIIPINGRRPLPQPLAAD